MRFKQIFKDFFGMVALDEKAYKQATKASFGDACIVFLLVAFASAFGSLFIPTEESIGIAFLSTLVAAFILLFVGWFIVTAVYWGSARLFGGKGSFMTHYNGLSLTLLWFLLSAIPYVGIFLAGAGSLWAIVMNIFFVREHHKLPTGKAASAVLIPWALFTILALIVVFGLILLVVTALQVG